MELYQRIDSAYRRIKNHARRTPLEKSLGISQITETDLYFKCEHLQETGSFKFRGATNKILSLTEEQRQRGVIVASSGNHGIASTLAAQRSQTQATVYVPETAAASKLDQITALGGMVKKVQGGCVAGELAARQASQNEGKEYISPYNDFETIAGQGTIGVELNEQCPDLDAVFISVGGGGLISGIAAYLKSVNPKWNYLYQ